MKKTILSACTTVLLLLVPALSPAQKKAITIDDIYGTHTFRTDYLYGLASMNDGIHYTTMNRTRSGVTIVKYKYSTGDSVATVFRSSELDTNIAIAHYTFSPDEKQLMFITDIERIYRHSTRENVFIYNLEDHSLKFISKKGKQRYTSFSPDGSKVAFVRDNDLFIYDLNSGEETQITTDGEHNKIINGATDWVYEEEFGFDKAFFWSGDSKYIAYYRFDESRVREFNMIMYKGQLYPTDYRFKYPKAGEDNSKVDIYIYDLKKQKTTKADIPETEYIPRVKWSMNPWELAIQTLNRHQNDLHIYLVNVKKNTAKEIYHETSSTYVDITDDWTFTANNDMIISSEKDGFNHLYQIAYKTGAERQLTKGEWDITAFYGYNENTGMLYFQAAKESPTQREIYSLDIVGLKMKKISAKPGWNDAEFSASFDYFINMHSTANTPYRYTIMTNEGIETRTVVTNEKLIGQLSEYEISPKTFFTFKTEQGTLLHGWMIKPADFDENKKYPVLLSIYGGPGIQTVTDNWGGSNYYWHQVLAQKGYIVVSVDNRGTGARGAEFKKATYKQLGKLELEDFIETAKYLGSQSYIDSSRIGIWGWSYGGYMSTLAISKGADYFSTAIAVAPVTSWRYYDNIYTERYMQTPQENPEGYDDNSPINFVEKIKGNYLLIHGMADDNVHFQNAAELIRALIKANVQFDMMAYPDKNHGIYGGNTRRHLYEMMTKYIEEHL